MQLRDRAARTGRGLTRTTPSSAAAWIVALIAIAATIAIASSGRTSEPDVYWHMAVAREVLKTHGTIPNDVFSYSFAGTPWPHKDLLAELVLYGLFRAFGYVGFALLKGAAAALLVAALAAMPARGARSAFGLVVVGGLTATSFWFLEQPNVFSLVLFGVVLALVERARRRGESTSRRELFLAIAPLVAATWCWTWLHRFALLGHLLLVVFAVDAWLSRRAWSAAPRRLVGPAVSRPFAVAASLAALASPIVALANPSGTAVFSSIITMASHGELRAHFYEWKSAPLSELFQVFPVACIVGAVALLLASVRLTIAARREPASSIRLSHAAIVVATVVATATSVRWLPFMAIASIATVALVVGDVTTSEAWRTVRARRPALVALLVACLGALAVVRMTAQVGEADRSLGEDTTFFPHGAVVFAREHGLSGKVANAFDFGGYLIFTAWPDVRVLVDGRNELVYPAEFVVRALAAERDARVFHAMRAEDGATWALGLNFPGKPGFGFLARDPRWSLVYWSDTGAIYTRRDAHPELEVMRYRFIDPLALEPALLQAVERAHGDPPSLAAIQAEIDRMLADSPHSVRATVLLALFHHALGPSHLEARNRALDELERIASGDPRAMRIVSELRR